MMPVRWYLRTPLLALVLCGLAAAAFTYKEALPGHEYSFPRDHFEHEEFRTEWWYYTGNVTGERGERYGFELVFFREGERHESQNPSVWDPQQLYLAHAALTSVNGKRFRYDERLNRPGPGIAGASFDNRRIWNGNWSVKWTGTTQTLEAITGHFRFHLQAVPETPPIIQGVNGVSQKAEGPGRASHYVSFPRLRIAGAIQESGEEHRVKGTAWMDHEWFTHQLGADQQGWDWFSVQLNDSTELMLFELRRKDGSLDPYSSGTFIDASGKATHLKREDFQLQPLETWTSPETKAKYPVRWRIRVPSRQIDIVCAAAIPNQELRARTGGPAYWEGAVDYSGTHRGVGYLEMTGYNGAVRM